MFLLQRVDETLKKAKSQLANILTLCNISFGGAAIMATFHDAYSHAVLYIFLAALCDRYDGKVARKFNQQSELGKQLDSMSDIISFGVAPALLIYGGVLAQFGPIGMVATVLYIVCGAFRLARFNTMESNGYFTGLPITAAGVIATVSFFAAPFINPGIYLILFLVLSYVMVANFKLKKV